MPTTDIRPNRLKELRGHSKLTQKEVAKLMDLSLSTVNKHEGCLRGLSQEDIVRYARIYKVPTLGIFLSPEELGISGDDSETTYEGGHNGYSRALVGA